MLTLDSTLIWMDVFVSLRACSRELLDPGKIYIRQSDNRLVLEEEEEAELAMKL